MEIEKDREKNARFCKKFLVIMKGQVSSLELFALHMFLSRYKWREIDFISPSFCSGSGSSGIELNGWGKWTRPPAPTNQGNKASDSVLDWDNGMIECDTINSFRRPGLHPGKWHKILKDGVQFLERDIQICNSIWSDTFLNWGFLFLSDTVTNALTGTFISCW